jgi:hypothetical protein
MPGSKSTIARVRPVPIVRVPPDVLRPGPEAAHVAGVDADVVALPLFVDQLELDPPGPRAQALLVELDDAGLRHHPERQGLCSGFLAAASSHQRGARDEHSPRQARAAIRSHALKLLRTGAHPRATLNHPKDHLEVGPSVFLSMHLSSEDRRSSR